MPTLPRPLLSVTVILALTSCSEPESDSAALSVKTYRVSRGDLRIAVSERAEIQASGQLTVSSGIQGRATLIYLAPEGTLVETGDKLAQFDVSHLEDNRSRQAIAVAKAEAAVAQARKSFEIMEQDLEAVRTAAESRLQIARMELQKFRGAAPTDGPRTRVDGTNRTAVQKLRQLLEAESEIGTHGGLVDSLLELLGSEGDLDRGLGELGNRVLEQIDGIRLARAQLEIHRDTFGHSENLAEQGFITRNELERDRLNYQSQLSRVNLAWNELDLLVNYTLRQNLIALTQDVENAELNLMQTLAANDARRLREDVELTSKEAELRVAAERLANWEQQLAGAVIDAPGAGLVVHARQGRSRWSSQPVEAGMELRERQPVIHLPDLSEMVAELRVQESEIDYLEVGQPAAVTVNAVPDRVFSGEVLTVASLPDSSSGWSQGDQKLYKTTIVLDGTNADRVLRPGMNARAEILVDRLIDVLSVPLPAIQRAGSTHFVWKLTDAGPVPTAVEIGIPNLTRVHVVAGLQEGDVVYLAPPTGVAAPEFIGGPDGASVDGQ